ncbi:hypothetical protein HDU83_009106 [Entophlyctis luteolus]|nr:hypothetical protein HDU82_006830 [Entophlyctis luteolus]KAJ3351190.1 hypothetical protein HDU83_009106 [Entophlyctis luteolus]KAJ3389574.1 hypothetical protein HDU84_008584 [Entophlyctis sp. JEL0112]
MRSVFAVSLLLIVGSAAATDAPDLDDKIEKEIASVWSAVNQHLQSAWSARLTATHATATSKVTLHSVSSTTAKAVPTTATSVVRIASTATIMSAATVQKATPGVTLAVSSANSALMSGLSVAAIFLAL